MITDEQIEQLRWKLKHEINGELQENMRKEERRLTKEWLAPILAAECNRLLDECLGICVSAEKENSTSRGFQAARYIKRRIEAIRHE